MILIGLLLLVGVVVLAVGGWDNFKALFQQNTGAATRTSLDRPFQGPSPEDILRERYAQGELGQEEYLEAQQILAR